MSGPHGPNSGQPAARLEPGGLRPPPVVLETARVEWSITQVTTRCAGVGLTILPYLPKIEHLSLALYNRGHLPHFSCVLFRPAPFYMLRLNSMDFCRNERMRILELLDQLLRKPLKSSDIPVQPVIQFVLTTCREGKVSLCLHAVHEPLKLSLPSRKIYPRSSPSVQFPYAFGHQRMQ